jgi:hypothetical protein
MNMFGYVGNNSINWIDSFGLDKHHVIPRQIWKDLPLSPDVRRNLEKNVVEMGKHGWSKTHEKYSDLLKSLWDENFARVKPQDITEKMLLDFEKQLWSNQTFNELFKDLAMKGGFCKLPKPKGAKLIPKLIPVMIPILGFILMAGDFLFGDTDLLY